jgi:hypothetical protein
MQARELLSAGPPVSSLAVALPRSKPIGSASPIIPKDVVWFSTGATRLVQAESKGPRGGRLAINSTPSKNAGGGL